MNIQDIKSNYPELPVHEAASKVPEMRPEQFRALLRDVLKNGMVNPIWIKDGQIIDGRHRYRIIQKLYKHHRLNFEPAIQEWPNDNIEAAVESFNTHRRHLNSSQLALIGYKLLPAIEAEASIRMKAGQQVVQGQKGKSIEIAAKQVGANKEYVRLLKKVSKQCEEFGLLKFIHSGQLNVRQTEKIITLDEMTRDNIVDAMETHNLTYSDAVKQLNIEGQSKKSKDDKPISNLNPEDASQYTLAGVLTLKVNEAAQQEIMDAIQAVLHKYGYTKEPIKVLFSTKATEARSILEQHYDELKNLSYEYGYINPQPNLVQ